MNSPLSDHRRARLLGLVGAMLCLVLLLWEHFKLGLFERVLLNAVALFFLAAGALVLYLNRRDDFSPDWVLAPVLLGFAVPGLVQLGSDSVLSFHYLYLVPFLTYFCLTMKLAHGVNLLTALLALAVLLGTGGDVAAYRQLGIFSLLAVSVASYVLLVHQKRAVYVSLTLRDPESGAYNSSQFIAVLKREVSRARLSRAPLSLIALTIDDHAQLREAYGERLLARVLPDLVNAMRDRVRAADDVFRLREDLFVLLLPACPEDGAIILMERVRRQLQQRQWPAIGEISLSAVSVTGQTDETAEQLERRMLVRLSKQRRARLEGAAF